LSAQSRFRRKEKFSLSATSKRFFGILSLRDSLGQAKIGESSGLIEKYYISD
jgi:hypothetical protein